MEPVAPGLTTTDTPHCPPASNTTSRMAGNVSPWHWSLEVPAAGQPKSFRFLSALLFCRDSTIVGHAIDTNAGQHGNRAESWTPLHQAELNTPANIWYEYRANYLAGTPAAAKTWLLQHENRVRSRSRRTFGPRTSDPFTLPSNLSFSDMPDTAHDNFRQANWQTCVSRHDVPSTAFFNAFTFLHLLPKCQRGTTLGFPEKGISFDEGRAVLQSIRWFFELPLSGHDPEPERDARTLRATPLLRGLSLLHDLISVQSYNNESFCHAWETDPPRTQFACFYRLLQDINALLEIFASLVIPVYGEAPFFSAAIQHRSGGISTTTLLSPYYSAADSPIDPRHALERPNILAAFATWEDRVSAYYRDVGSMDPSFLGIAPASMFFPSYPVFTKTSSRSAPSLPPSTVTQSLASRPEGSVSTVGMEGADGKTQSTNKGKPKLSQKAIRPLLQFVSPQPPGAANPAAQLKSLPKMPKFPCQDSSGTPAPDANLICFAFTTAGENYKGCKRPKCRYVHLDAGSLPPGTIPIHFSALRQAITGPLATAFTFTSDGDRLTNNVLDAHSESHLIATAPAWRLKSIFGSYDTSPLAPPSRRRYRGFGKRSTSRSAAHDSISHELLGHFAWPYLDGNTRFSLVQACPTMFFYARLLRYAASRRHDIFLNLQRPRPSPHLIQGLCPHRTRDMGAAFLLFNCCYGDLVRWLGGEYTNQHRNWDALQVLCDRAEPFEPPAGYPVVDFALSQRALREGVPLRGHFSCSSSDTRARIRYNNHPPVARNADAVREKFASEEANSFHISFPRFLAMFIHGLFVSPISWIIQKGKGRIIIDASTKLGNADSGAPNDYIPNTGTPGAFEENPPVYYGSAVRRHAEHIWNLRITYPDQDILQHSDDINAAFRQILYHPDLAPVFGYVFQEFVLIPVGQIFGSRSAPSWWCQPAECRAHTAAVLDYNNQDLPLADKVKFPDPPTPVETAAFTLAVPDQIHQGVLSSLSNRTHHTMFVDDNITVAIRSRMQAAIRAAVGSAYDFFGHPAASRRDPCLKATKFPTEASYIVTHLGYVFDTRQLRVTWPLDKQQSLHTMLSTWMQSNGPQRAVDIARVLGLIRHGAFLCPMGDLLSIRLQWTLNEAVHQAGSKRSATSRWWRHQMVPIPNDVHDDLALLHQCTNNDNQSTHSHIWSRPISMLVRRQHTALAYSDASYGGIGGWCPKLRFFWRLLRPDLVQLGFNLSSIERVNNNLRSFTEHGTHINILEFVAIIVNLWLVIHFVRQPGTTPTGGHVVAIVADNTSALSWLKFAARNRAPVIRHLALFCHGLLTLSLTSDYLTVDAIHLPGQDNSVADALSRPEIANTLDIAIAQFPVLKTCHACRIPYALLSYISKLLSGIPTGVPFVGKTTELLTAVPSILPLGAHRTACRRGYSRRSHRGSSSR